MQRVEVGYGPGELIHRKRKVYGPPAKLDASAPEAVVVFSSFTREKKQEKPSAEQGPQPVLPG